MSERGRARPTVPAKPECGTPGCGLKPGHDGPCPVGVNRPGAKRPEPAPMRPDPTAEPEPSGGTLGIERIWTTFDY